MFYLAYMYPADHYSFASAQTHFLLHSSHSMRLTAVPNVTTSWHRLRKVYLTNNFVFNSNKQCYLITCFSALLYTKHKIQYDVHRLIINITVHSYLTKYCISKFRSIKCITLFLFKILFKAFYKTISVS